MMHTRRRLASVCLAFVTLFSAGCASLVSDADLEAQGRNSFDEMREQIPLVGDRATIEFVSCVADAVVLQLEPPWDALDWELAIFDQTQINAFVLPGGKMGVFSGILAVARNQHQLAAVMGHEVAHVTERHSAERIARAKATQYGVNVLTGVAASSPIAARSASTALQIGSQLGLLLPFSRGQETEADEVGLIYMARAGFDPRESVKLWQNMLAASGDDGPPELLSTHPSGDTRITQLVAMLPAALLEYNKAKAAGLNPNCPRPSYLDPPATQN